MGRQISQRGWIRVLMFHSITIEMRQLYANERGAAHFARENMDTWSMQSLDGSAERRILSCELDAA